LTQRNGLAWLAPSSDAIARARSVLAALRQPGVIDELGFLMLNGAFAEHLYPGVTTIMTRARYFFFVPAIYRHLEQSRKAVGKDTDRLSRDLQFELRNALERNETSFIGKEGGRNLIRVPSAIYWSALGALGISTQRLSEATYQRRLSEGAYGMRVYKDDDDAAHNLDTESLWDPGLRLGYIMPDGKFPGTTSFLLRKAEAASLKSRYAALLPDGQENLVSCMVSLGRQHGRSGLADMQYPWDIPAQPVMTTVLEDARRLSLLARGATLQYYWMLLDKRKEADPGVEDAFVDWWDQAKEDLASWDLQSFFTLLARWGVGRGSKDREFITSWIERCLPAATGRAALGDREAQRIVGRREDHVRPGKQRLRIKHQLEAWRLPDGFAASIYQMDYRHRVGRQIAADIVEGLERGAA
jgi:hypothetical protein